MKIIIFIGNSPHHKFLAQQIMSEFNVVKVIIDNKKGKTFKKNIIKKLFSFYIELSWKKMMFEYEKKLKKFDANIVEYVDNINNIDSSILSKYSFDYVVVSGTSLLKKKLIKIIGTKKILNLHTGLSPYVNGGPNCTNWCISENRFDLIGNTIMWLDEGIDSGNIIFSKKTLENSKRLSFREIHNQVINQAHSMYLDVLRKLNFDEKSLKSINQNIIYHKTKTYKTKDWTNTNVIKLHWNILFRRAKQKSANIKTVDL